MSAKTRWTLTFVCDNIHASEKKIVEMGESMRTLLELVPGVNGVDVTTKASWLVQQLEDEAAAAQKQHRRGLGIGGEHSAEPSAHRRPRGRNSSES